MKTKIQTVLKRGRPRTGETPRRCVRVADEEWKRWESVAKRRKTDVSNLIRARMAEVK